MAARASETGEEMRWSVAAVARALGVAPATLRTWDRRYGVGPSGHREGQHRRYTEVDLGRLEMMRRLLLQGVSTAEAARAATTTQRDEGPPPEVSERMTGPALGRPGRSRPANMTVRQLREAALRMDADRVVALLSRAVDEHGVTVVWETLLRPALSGIGDRWAADVGCIAAEHLLSECATRVLHQGMRGRMRRARPVLLVCAPGEAHVLPLHALAAALAERSVPSRLLGAATPAGATMAAARRLQPSAVVVWAQSPQTADPEVFAALPLTRGGRLLVAAALRILDALDAELEPLRRQITAFADRQPGCQALQADYGIGPITATALWTELGDSRRFSASRKAVRHTGLDITVHSSDGKRPPGHLSRQGSPLLRWALFEAAQCAARPGSPDHAYYRRVADRVGGNRAALSVARKMVRRAHHTLRALGDQALAPV